MSDDASGFNPKTAIYTPQEASVFAIEGIKNVQSQKSRGIILDIPEIRDYFAPLLPGQICVVLGQTSHYKSGFVHSWERKVAYQLMREDRLDEVIVHISVEESVEEQVYLELSRYTGNSVDDFTRGEIQDWSKLEEQAVVVGQVPIYRIGDSLACADDTPNLYLSNILRSLDYLVEGHVTGRKLQPALIVVDYLQALPIDPEVRRAGFEMQRRLQVREDMYRLRQATTRYRSPIVVNVQAKQNLDGAPSKELYIPGMYDGEESASIAQRADRIISVWLPARTHVKGTNVDFGFGSFRVSDDDLFVRVMKQRGGYPAGKLWHCKVDFMRNEIVPAVMSKYDRSTLDGE